ncbi:7251_t:CDS:1, partial [Cetraspora pellucida]
AFLECDKDEDRPKEEDEVETHPVNLTDESEVIDENRMDWKEYIKNSDYVDEEKFILNTLFNYQ